MFKLEKLLSVISEILCVISHALSIIMTVMNFFA